MLTKFHKTRKAFTTVEILVAVGLVAILMVVAVPRLLDSRKTVSDSAAKQQLSSVMLSVNNWFAERDTYTGLTEAVLQTRLPEIDIVAAGASTGKLNGGRALAVSFSGVSASEVILAASNGEDICWAVKIGSTGTKYAGKKNTLPAACNAGGTYTWADFEFPLDPS